MFVVGEIEDESFFGLILRFFFNFLIYGEVLSVYFFVYVDNENVFGYCYYRLDCFLEFCLMFVYESEFDISFWSGYIFR